MGEHFWETHREDKRVAMENRCKVCVTGGAGYIASLLVKKLLEQVYTVHATLRNLSNLSLPNSISDSCEQLLIRLNFIEDRLSFCVRARNFTVKKHNPQKIELLIRLTFFSCVYLCVCLCACDIFAANKFSWWLFM